MNFLRFKVKFNIKDLAYKDLVIFDEGGSEHITRLLPDKYSYFVYPLRKINIYISFKIFFIYLRLLFLKWDKVKENEFNYSLKKLLYSIYHLSCLSLIKPKIIITFADNSDTYHWLSKNFEGVYFIAIQNGNRTKIQLINSNKFYHQHFFCFGHHEIEKYKEEGHVIKYSYPLGSLLSDFYKISIQNKKFTKIYQIAIISQFGKSIIDESNVKLKNYIKSLKLMHTYAAKYIYERNIKAIVIPRYSEGDQLFTYEKEFLRSFYEDFVTYRITDRAKFSTYQTMDESEVSLSFFSTSTIEAFGLGNKILHCDFTNTNLYNDYDSMIMFDKPNYKLFRERLDLLIDESNETYNNRTKSYRKKIMNNNSKHSISSIVRKKIEEIISKAV